MTSIAERCTPPTEPLWQRHARQWARIKPPLRPAGEDLVWAQEIVDRHGRAGMTVGILGVTPELARLSWPAHTRLLAMDYSMPMVRGVWPTDHPPTLRPQAILGNWLNLPLADRGCDMVLGDGCYVLLNASQPPLLNREVRRVLRPGGLFVIRVFIRPDVDESPEQVWNDLTAGRIGNFHIFKFRLLMSLRRNNGEVHVADACAFFDSHCDDHESLAADLNWDVDEIRTIEAYRNQPAIYWYPTLGEFREMARPHFHEIRCDWPTYEMGDRCPTFVLQARY
jgi:SAM-dependent methyltransferase